MPRAAKGPTLKLYGPDTRFGARKKAGRRDYTWYIVWKDAGGVTRELTTGFGRLERVEAEQALSAFLVQRHVPVADKPVPAKRRRNPSDVSITDVLSYYGTHRAPALAAGQRIYYAIKALLPFWGDMTVDEIYADNCAAYLEARRAQPRRDNRKAKPGQVIEPKPHKPVTDGTVRRELGVLETACGFYADQGWMTKTFTHPTLPPPSPRRERWLTRSEVAALLWAARRDKRARPYLPLYILIGYYTGARPNTILDLQVRDNTTGGGVVRWDDNIIDFLGRRNDTSKTKPKIRIPRRLRRFLDYARKRVRQHILETKRTYTGAEGNLIEGGDVGDIGKSFATAVAAAGLGPDVTPYTLRHTNITWLKQKGVSSWEVAKFVGTSEEMIESHYGHYDPNHDSAAAAAFD